MIVEIDGDRYEVNTEENNPDVVLRDDRTYQMTIAGVPKRISIFAFDLNAGTCTVEMDGQLRQVRIINDLEVMIEKMGLNTSLSKKQSQIAAPMPGLVTSLKVKAGDHVLKGAPLLILEAMKMENVISAPHDAIIKLIKVNVSQAVERGLALMEFE